MSEGKEPRFFRYGVASPDAFGGPGASGLSNSIVKTQAEYERLSPL
jgi:hypothetical protein